MKVTQHQFSVHIPNSLPATAIFPYWQSINRLMPYLSGGKADFFLHLHTILKNQFKKYCHENGYRSC
jgi:hypothetical protein